LEWHDEQKLLMSKAGDAIVQQQSCEVEHEILFLPSDFPCNAQQKVKATMLGAEEAKL
jgi:hypothetical protein